MFNPETEYHTKNKLRQLDRRYWDDVFGAGQLYAVSPATSTLKVSEGLF